MSFLVGPNKSSVARVVTGSSEVRAQAIPTPVKQAQPDDPLGLNDKAGQLVNKPTPEQLTTFLADPTRADVIPVEVIPMVLCQLAILQNTLAARLVAGEAYGRQDDTSEVREDRLLTVHEVADRLGVKASYAYDLVRQGKLPTVRFGRYVRVPLVGLRQWIVEHTA